MKTIPSLPGYLATLDGEILTQRSYRGQRRPLAAQPSKDGYLRVKPTVNGKERWMSVHRLVAEAYHGPCPEGMQCRHLDGDKTNNRPENLRWGTAVENAADRKVHGTESSGERHPNSQKTHCPQGHEYTDETTRYKSGKRHCAICLKEQNAAYYRRAKAEGKR